MKKNLLFIISLVGNLQLSMSQTDAVLNLETLFNYNPNKVSFIKQKTVLQGQNPIIFKDSVRIGNRNYKRSSCNVYLWPEGYKTYMMLFEDSVSLNAYINQEFKKRLIVSNYYNLPTAPPFQIVSVKSNDYCKFILTHYQRRLLEAYSSSYEKVYELMNGQILALNMFEDVEESLMFVNREQFLIYKNLFNNGEIASFLPDYPADYSDMLGSYIGELTHILGIVEDISDFSIESLDLVSNYIYNYSTKADIYLITQQVAAYYIQVLLETNLGSRLIMKSYDTSEGVKYLPFMVLSNGEIINVGSIVNFSLKHMMEYEFNPALYW